MSEFWHPIPDKNERQKALEARVFGCDDLWRHIKTFIFSQNACWALASLHKGPCVGDVFVSYAQKHTFCHFRQGALKRGVYTTRKYTCRKHATTDPDNPCIIS